MAKMTIDGNVFEGTTEELRELFDMMGVKFPTQEADEPTPYKTVKRHAKVGERILITEAAPIHGQSYDEGAVFTVTKVGVRGRGDVYVKGQTKFIDYLEYEVIVESDTKPEPEKAPVPPLKVGDTVEVLDGSASEYGDFVTGTVGVITDIELGWPEPYRVDADDDFDRFPAKALRKMESEVTNEPKTSEYPQNGDVVRVTNDRYNGGFMVGSIGLVMDADETFRPLINVGDSTGYAEVEIVARAKDRVDIA